MTSEHVISEDEKFLQFNAEGQTALVTGNNFDPNCSYRKVHYTHEDKRRSGVFSKGAFKDPEYQIDVN